MSKRPVTICVTVISSQVTEINFTSISVLLSPKPLLRAERGVLRGREVELRLVVEGEEENLKLLLEGETSLKEKTVSNKLHKKSRC